MPSPFPGMDPYLEGSGWSSIHHQLSDEVARYLTPRLRPNYIVQTKEYFVSESPDDIAITLEAAYPDVGVAQAPVRREMREPTTAWMTAPLEIATVIPSRVPHVTIEIRMLPIARSSRPLRFCRQPISAVKVVASI